MSSSYIQVRTNQSDKEQASEILEKLGTNLSAVVNMLLKQIIMTNGIPFEIKMNKPYSMQDEIAEVNATLSIEDLQLSPEDQEFLATYQQSSDANRELLRKAAISSLVKDNV